MENDGASLSELARRADVLAGQALSDATTSAYSGDWAGFQRWCTARDLQALPAEGRTVGLWIVELAEWAAVSTIGRRLAAVSYRHRQAGLDDPTKDPWVRQIHSGIRRTKGIRPAKQAPALRLDDLHTMVDTLPHDRRGERDRAVLLTAWWSALRSSELVSLLARDVEVVDGGLAVLVRRAKNDQLGHGRHVALPRLDHPDHCPVAAIERWRSQTDGSGYLFVTMDRWGNTGTAAMSTRAVHRLISRAGEKAGVEGWEMLSPHSTRSGFITTAASVASEAEVAAQSGHNSVAVLRSYIRGADHFQHNAVARLVEGTRPAG